MFLRYFTSYALNIIDKVLEDLICLGSYIAFYTSSRCPSTDINGTLTFVGFIAGKKSENLQTMPIVKEKMSYVPYLL